MPISTSSPACSSVVVFLITGASKGLGRAIATVASRYYAQQQQSKLRHNTNINSSSSSSSYLSSTKQARFVLVARSSKGLQETKNEILSNSTIAEAEVALSVDSNSTITFPNIQTLTSSTTTTTNEDAVICRTMDLSDLDLLDDNIEILLDDVDRLIYCCDDNDIDNNGDDNQRHDMDVDVVFMNNAGSLGYLGPTVSSPSLMDMRQTIDLNITSSLWLSVRFAKYVKQQQEQNQKRRPCKTINILNATIVNISSLLAISDDILTMGIYSTGKAARERYHTVLGKEEIKRIKKKDDDESYNNNNDIIIKEEVCNNNKNDSNTAAIKTLNYAPGPLETDMAKEIREADELDDDLKPHFQKKLLDSADSALKLIKVIEKNEFDSGSHIDYYDLP